jgi:hypothetical protein
MIAIIVAGFMANGSFSYEQAIHEAEELVDLITPRHP